MSPSNLYDALAETEERCGDRPAIRFIEEMTETEPSVLWTYRDLLGRLRGAANLFHDCGIDDKSSVALLIPNVPYGQVALFAAEIAGRALPVNPLLPDEHIVKLLTAANTKVLVIADGQERVKRFQAQVPTLDHIFTLDDGPSSFRKAVEHRPQDALSFPHRQDGEAIVASFHTGGTTGVPKLAIHRQSNQLAVAQAMAKHGEFVPDDILVNALPLFHVAGSMCFALTSMVAGACQMLCTYQGARHPDFVGEQWPMIENHGVTILGGVPTTMGALVPGIPDRIPPRLRKVITGGAPLPLSVECELEERLGVEICLVYGMTECAGLLAMRAKGDRTTPGWTGHAVTGMEIRIVGDTTDATGTKMPAMTVGHVIARGATVCPGYTDPAFNKSLFTPDGWLITGDLGMMDTERNLMLTGRAKDLIIRSGHNIDPAVIEEAALKHPSVRAAAAVGAPDAYAGEVPVLFIEAEAGKTIDVDALLTSLREQVERPAVPKWVEIIDGLPLTAVGKIYKPALVARAIELTLRQLLDAQSEQDISLSVVENSGAAKILFRPRPEHRKIVENLMAPFTLTYEISEET